MFFGCAIKDEGTSDIEFFESSLKEIGLTEKFDYDMIGRRIVASENDYVDIITCEVSYTQGKLLRDYIYSELIGDSTIGIWSVDDRGFSFNTPKSTSHNGRVYALEYSFKTGVLVIKVIKV
ncbi:MAG: hypothetical protein A3D92_11110 [Bacteroidetes bacterium RIFCSPHIGHO2_02_FULL_44_7]|nr:MAG: hypothetical protein A3D92_11110 [Bacteroidetes bacterium RIFCSPHIGHO2_02_FULL_44_7]